MIERDVDLLVVGGNPAGLSLAAEAAESGLDRIVVIERSDTVVPADAAGRLRLDVEYQTAVVAVTDAPDGSVLVTTTGRPHRARAVAFAEIPPGRPVEPDYHVPSSLTGRVHFAPDALVGGGHDVLVVGGGEQAVAFTEALAERGDHPVLAVGGRAGRLCRLSQDTLHRLETDRKATVLWHGLPDGIEDVGGFPMAVFEDRRTPDLQFDHVVFALGVEVEHEPFAELGADMRASAERVFLLQDRNEVFHHPVGSVVPAGSAWATIRARLFPDLRPPAVPGPAPTDELRGRLYNATITRFEKAHSDLWILRVRPDMPGADHRAGQYATLGLGYWEPRIDGARDRLRQGQEESLVRRSYSISSRIVDDHGYLVDPHLEDELEFYVVLVPPGTDRVPALTPRLALKQVGDRIYLGPRIAGRYTLDHVTRPGQNVVLLATGTGEAPHNAMLAELLRKGHHGPILSAVSVRKASDLGYRTVHAALEERFSNYRYLPLPTREPDVPKRYIQDVIADGTLEERLGTALEPGLTDVFLCGNPLMIGPPEWDGDEPVFPEPRGAVEVLHERGFRPDRRGAPGQVHYEEYW